MTMTLDPESTVVVDIGGTKIMAALASDSIGGDTRTIPTPLDGPDKFIGGLIDLIRSVHPSPSRVVVATPDAVDRVGHQHIELANIGVSRLPLRETLENDLDVEVHLIGDAEAGAVAEFAAGAAAAVNADDGIYITVSTGIGAGLVLDGRLRVHDGVGEIGHTPVRPESGIVCGCGAVGCLETVASGSGIAGRATAVANQSPYLSAVLATRPITARDVSEAAEQGDAKAAELIADGVAALAEVTAGLVRALAPQVIVLGGGFAVGTSLRDPLERAVRVRLSASRVPIRTTFLEAGFGRRSVLAGAALLAGHPDFRAGVDLRPAALARSQWGTSLLGGVTSS